MSNLSFVRHVGDGTTTHYVLAIAGENMGYFRTTDIKVYVNGTGVASRVDFTSPHIVILEVAPSVGADVLIRREMPEDKPYANFERGNNFGHRQVNNTFVQQLYLTQEIIDGFKTKDYYEKQNLNMGGFQLDNLRKGTEAGNAVEYEQWDERAVDGEDRIEDLENSTKFESNITTMPFRYTAAGGESIVTTNYIFGFALLYINGIGQTLGNSFNILEGDFLLAEPLEEGDSVYAVISKPFQSYATFVGSGDWFYTAMGGEVQIEMGVVFSKMILTINGIVQIPTQAYSTLGTSLTLAEPLEVDDCLYAIVSS